MARRFVAALVSLLTIGLTVAGQVPAALQKMADTERAFARRAQEATVREAFIEFFADEAIGFEPGPVPARESLRKRPPPTVRVQLLWEPRYGDIAKSSDLGYTWEPFTEERKDGTKQSGYYVRVWTRTADGQWQLVADITAPKA